MRVWLKDLRESKGLTQQNVADYLGITKQYYQMVESGSRAKIFKKANERIAITNKLIDFSEKVNSYTGNMSKYSIL